MFTWNVSILPLSGMDTRLQKTALDGVRPLCLITRRNSQVVTMTRK